MVEYYFDSDSDDCVTFDVGKLPHAAETVEPQPVPPRWRHALQLNRRQIAQVQHYQPEAAAVQNQIRRLQRVPHIVVALHPQEPLQPHARRRGRRWVKRVAAIHHRAEFTRRRGRR